MPNPRAASTTFRKRPRHDAELHLGALPGTTWVNDMRTRLPTLVAIAALSGLLAIALIYMVDAWQHLAGHLTIHGWIALALGVFFSIVIGCGLMALLFYSSRRGYDEQPKAPDFHREVP
jgi:H+/Cl- antiporter ClcA